MLHRSFKPAKCKTALKLASSRIKLLKNKRDAQVKHLKRELAQLLESGQDQTARIRVEHVVREEKTLAAYDLLEIYCELIVARLAMIESQKTCPIDLKEAVASVIFASPRCADIPELMDVRKHLTAKYGKEFVSAAVELRPNCGVSRLLVEKLSANAPDGPTKVKILSAIAEEHNITWESKSFGEKDSKPPEDLLNGPNSFDKASKMLEDHRNVQAPPAHDVKGPPNFQVSPMSKEQHNVPASLHDPNARSLPYSQMDIGANRAGSSGPSHTELRPTGSGTDRMEFQPSYSGKGKDYSSGRQNWNMDFKDATAAAQAAAESAERASMAARAAAELSRHGKTTWQHATEPERHGEPQNFADSGFQHEHHAEDSGRNPSYGRCHYEQTDRDRQDVAEGSGRKFHNDSFTGHSKSNHSASLKSSEAYVDGSQFVNKDQMADRYSQGSSSKLEQNDLSSQPSFKRQSDKFKVNKLADHPDTKNVDDFKEVSVKKKSSHSSSHSHSRTFSDDRDSVSHFSSQTKGNDVDMNPFAANNETNQKHQHETKYHESAVVFDDSDSDDDERKINLEKKQDYGFGFSSPSRTPSDHLFANTNSWSSQRSIDGSRGKSMSPSNFSVEHHSGSIFSESLGSSMVSTQPKSLLPATFDDSAASSSESEEEVNKSKFFRDSSFGEEKEGSRKPLTPTFTNTKPGEVGSDRSEEIRISDESVRNSDNDDGVIRQTSLKSKKSKELFENSDGSDHASYDFTPEVAEGTDGTESSKEFNPDSGTELNFGMLTGGLKHKAYRVPLPPYTVSPSHIDSLSKKKTEDSTTRVDESPSLTVKTPVTTDANRQDSYNRKVTETDRRRSTRADLLSSDDDSDDELPQQTSAPRQESYSKIAGIGEKKKPSSRTKIKYFDSSDSDSENEIPKQVSTSLASANTGFSRRTKASPGSSDNSNNSRSTFSSEASVKQDHAAERGYSPRSSYGTETRLKLQSQEKSSAQSGNYRQQPRVEKEELGPKSSQQSKPKTSSFQGSPRLSAREQSYKTLPRISPGRTEILKSSSSVDSPSTEKARHVHPKLPDYDSLAAHLQSLRQNRK